MVPKKGWHGYWINPGESGLPVDVSWEAPEGIEFGELRHPAPTLLEVQGIASYVHEGTFTLLTEMSVPAGMRARFRSSPTFSGWPAPTLSVSLSGRR